MEIADIKQREQAKMMKDLKDSMLMGKGIMADAGSRTTRAVFPFEDAPKGWKRGSVKPRSKTGIDILLFKDYQSYVIVKSEGLKFCIPIAENVEVLQLAVATREIGFIRNAEDAEKKAKRKKFESHVELTGRQSQELYQGLLLFNDMAKKLEKEDEE